jgi:hypothetical protein
MNYNNFDARLRHAAAPKKRKDLTRRHETPAGVAGSARCRSAAAQVAGKMHAAATRAALVWVFAASACAASAQNYAIDLNAPSIDKWIYPFAPNGGATRTSGPTFGAVGSAGFDDRDAQYFARFNTTASVPPGLGANSYQILSATFTLSLSGGTLVYDSSYDTFTTYGPNGERINGDDPGRPIELFGAAYRNGFTSSTITETTSFGVPGESTRNIYATDFLLGASLSGSNRDVGNNIAGAFDPLPFAIGQVAPGDLSGGLVDIDADVVFTLNLANPEVLRYLQLSLNEGQVSFLATSLHEASQGGPTVYADFYTKENLLGGLPGRLDLEVQVVPEPASSALVLLGAGLLGIRRRAHMTLP